MTNIQLAFGGFRFATSTAEYHKLDSIRRWRWVQFDRVNRAPALQYQGPDAQEINIDCVVYADTASHVKIPADIAKEADSGQPLRLISGSETLGKDWGLWVIVELTNEHQHITPDGTPYKQTFTVRLKYYGTDNHQNNRGAAAG